jgi:hypothetical protein
VSLDDFFRHTVSMLRGQEDAAAVEAALGPCETGTDALQYYGLLQRVHRERQLAELFPTTKARIETRGTDAWRNTVGAYLVDHPPSHWSLPHIGATFADWLFEHDDDGALLGPLTDWMWVRWRARQASDAFEGDGLEVRLFVRSFGVDPMHVSKSIRANPSAPIEATQTTLLIWRREDTLHVRNRVPSLADIAVLWQRSGQSLQGPLAAISRAELETSEARMRKEAILVDSAA